MRRKKKNRILPALAAFAVLAALVFGMLVQSGLLILGGEIRNIIVMIPDGGGFGNFDLAQAVKRAGVDLPGMSTEVTADALHLTDYLAGTVVTRSADSAVTDSAAGGTAIATGEKTNNDAVSVSPKDGAPMATLLEASALAGKATGLVCTKFWYDATPAAFAAHAASRAEYDTITEQMLHRGLDVVLGGGTAENFDGSVAAQDLGYTVVKSETELAQAVAAGADRVWSSFSQEQGGSLPFDYLLETDAPEVPTLKEMTRAAIDLLSGKGREGFFLMVEGSRVDSGGHNSNALQIASEYLAFDEAFACAVNWAMEDGHTLVVVVPDHDTGGLTPRDEKETLRQIGAGAVPENCSWAGNGEHTGQNVPLFVYGPEKAVEKLMETMDLPAGGAQSARSGRYYEGVEFDPAWVVDNTALARCVAEVAGLDLARAQRELFVDITDCGTYADGVFTVKESGAIIPENGAWYLGADGTRVDFEFGVAVYAGERFYVPQCAAQKLTASSEER